jgi:23S rRNA (cytidine1920-2'-O)/16S rRNA (cytidine1409-2'-O)-methyltransferase
VIKTLLEPHAGRVLCLIKPQFEAGKENVGKKGVVRDPAVHEEVLRDFVVLAKSLSFTIKDITFSPVKGPEGNIEYLMYLRKCNEPQNSEEVIATAGELVERSHNVLDK